jgi:hypothetical protein
MPKPKRGVSQVLGERKDGKSIKARDESNRSDDNKKTTAVVKKKATTVQKGKLRVKENSPSKNKTKTAAAVSKGKAKGKQSHTVLDSDDESGNVEDEQKVLIDETKTNANEAKVRSDGEVNSKEKMFQTPAAAKPKIANWEESSEEDLPLATPFRGKLGSVQGQLKSPSGRESKVDLSVATPPRKHTSAMLVSPATGGSPTKAPNITPIAELNIFKGSKNICARVFEKSDLKIWNSRDGKKSGLLFSVKLNDAAGDTIQGTFFDGDEEFYDGVELNKVYTFNGGELKMANAQYNTCTSKMEFTFSRRCQIELVDDATVAESYVEDHTSSEIVLVTISTLEMFKGNQAIRARVTAKSPVRSFTTPKGTGSVFSVDLEDVSEKTVRATLFNDEAEIYHEMLKEDNWYIFTGFSVKRSVHSYDDCTSPYELRIEKGSKITLFLHTDLLFGDESS